MSGALAPILRLAGADFAPAGRYDWMDDAACRDADPRFWDTDVTPDQSVARTICGGCPVIAACAVMAHETKASWCTWAATDKRPNRGRGEFL